ncbi:PH domain-containing protein [Trujillonella endophytica]|uniref:PH domain-containing protein n=1 Tax=Trujillonella endophytica TaxID=673521 RepID=A0A1H8VBC3_9ACTN|nr:PH domain-containing protein [Trujillella endophytica]SEP12772.1 PH domain-containing protein [Trujillella endophytica]
MQWSARPGTALALAGAGVALGTAALLLEPVGRVLVGAAAALLLVLAARSALLRPRLSAEAGGVVVRRLTGRVRLPWAQLRVRVRETRRAGLRSQLLELDTAAGSDDAGVLVLLGRWELGADPADVARALEARRPA